MTTRWRTVWRKSGISINRQGSGKSSLVVRRWSLAKTSDSIREDLATDQRRMTNDGFHTQTPAQCADRRHKLAQTIELLLSFNKHSRVPFEKIVQFRITKLPNSFTLLEQLRL